MSDFLEWASSATVGEQIREARIAHQWTQLELGQRVGADNGYVSKVERNLIFPQASTLLRFAKALDVPIIIGPRHRHIKPGQANTPRPAETWHKPTCKQIHKRSGHRAIAAIHMTRPARPGRWISTAEAGERLGVTRDRARVVLREAGVPATRVRAPGPYWYRAEDVEALRRERATHE